MEPAPPIGIHLQDLGTGRAWSPVEWEDTSTEDCKACQSLVFKAGVTGVSRGCCSGYLGGIYDIYVYIYIHKLYIYMNIEGLVIYRGIFLVRPDMIAAEN